MNKKPKGMMPADKLPPLPEPLKDDLGYDYFLPDQLLAYGAACRAAALEEAAQVCDSWIVAKAIRSL